MAIAGILLGATAMQSAHADVTCPRCDDWKSEPKIVDDWKTKAKEAIENEAYNASLDERFKQLPITSNMPRWLTRPYPVAKRKRREH
jgi:hypothetical protein